MSKHSKWHSFTPFYLVFSFLVIPFWLFDIFVLAQASLPYCILSSCSFFIAQHSIVYDKVKLHAATEKQKEKLKLIHGYRNELWSYLLYSVQWTWEFYKHCNVIPCSMQVQIILNIGKNRRESWFLPSMGKKKNSNKGITKGSNHVKHWKKREENPDSYQVWGKQKFK